MQTPAPFEYERAGSVDDALALLERHGPEARLVAGGHSLLPMMKLRLARPEVLIDINDLHDKAKRFVSPPWQVRQRMTVRRLRLTNRDGIVAVAHAPVERGFEVRQRQRITPIFLAYRKLRLGARGELESVARILRRHLPQRGR